MPADFSGSLSVAVVSEPPGTDAHEDHDLVTKCGRCRLSFVRHPSVIPGDSSKWWLCPPCRAGLLGDEARTDARWGSAGAAKDPGRSRRR